MPRPRSFADETELARTRRARRITRELAVLYPDAHCELDFRNPLELLVATILSAQTTDVRVNMVTPVLFAKYRTAADYAAADRAEMETIVASTGFFRAEDQLRHRHGPGPRATGTAARCRPRLDDLVTLPGVGRKTANVVLGNAFGVPGITVDTHFGRLVPPLRLDDRGGPGQGRARGRRADPEEGLDRCCRTGMIWHGRRRCFARKPACGACPVAQLCPSYGEGETDPEKAAKLVKPDSAFSTVPAAPG